MWSFDVVALWHNAIRFELCDLEDIVCGLMEGSRTVTLFELQAFFAWFSTFEAFVVTCLKAEEEVMFPWLEKWGHIKGSLSTANRITTKGSIIRGIRDTAACAAMAGLDGELPHGMVLTNPHRTYYDGLKVGFAEAKNVCSSVEAESNSLHCRVLERVAGHISNFSSTLLTYFQEQESSLPTIIDSLYDEEDAISEGIERRMIRGLWKCGRKDESMVIVLRAVMESPFHKHWTHRNLRRVERFTVPLWKRRYSLGRGAVTAKFRERYVEWERHAASLHVGSGTTGARGANFWEEGMNVNVERKVEEGRESGSVGGSGVIEASWTKLSSGDYTLSHGGGVDSASGGSRLAPVEAVEDNYS